MRTIQRTPARVPTLFSDDGSGFKKARAHLSAFGDGGFDVNTAGSNNFTFTEHWKKPDVRGALYAQQGKVCAYCGCDLPRNDRGDVEHFRPKKRVTADPGHGGYWWVAYAFDNYVLSCSICNRYRKSSRFPLRRNARRVTFADRGRLPREARALLHPAVDDIEHLVRVDWRRASCPIRAADGVSGVQRAQVDGMIELFRLNIDSELVGERIEVADTVVRLLDAGNVTEAARHAIRYRPHSLVARQILLDRGAEAHLPTPQDEFEWLFNALFDDLDRAMELLEQVPGDDILKDEVGELLWAFTVLAAGPQPGAPADLDARLERLGLKGLVDARMRQMV
jgi:uncharacterized protein (TIGR02646 family)